MIYTLIGKAVVKAVRIFLRRKYGPTLVPKPLLAGSLVALVVGLLIVLLRREESA